MNWTLVAFYIQEHRLFGKETTINLGGKYFYDIKYLKGNFNISRKENLDFIDGFYGEDISMISAIIGANGSGKTSIISEVINNPETILIFESGLESCIVKNEYRFTIDKAWWGVYIKDKKALRVSISKKALDSKHLDKLTVDFNRKKAPNILYYNPLAHINPSLSTMNVAKVEYRGIDELAQRILANNLRVIGDKDLVKEIETIYPNFPQLAEAKIYTEHLKLQDLWDIEMILSGANDDENIPYKERVENLENRVSDNSYIEKVNFLYRWKGSEILNSRLSSAIKVYVMARILVHIDEVQSKYNLKEEAYISNINSNFSVEDIIGWLEKLQNSIPDGKKNSVPTAKYFIKLSIEWLKKYPIEEKLNSSTLEELIESEFFLIQQELENIYQNSYTTDFSRNMNFKLAIVSPLYSFSQGEETLLNIISSFVINEDFSQNRSNILFLDEATVGFHPIWQKKFINAIIKILPLIHRNKLVIIEDVKAEPKPIQIIFTSHDPFSLSDLPSHNITYLHKNDGISRPLSRLEAGKKKSFGANITHLLEDSFFLGEGDDSLVGEFAQEKINNVIGWINDEQKKKYGDPNYKVSNEIFEDNKKVISLIDEPILQIKLAEMLDELKGDKQMQTEIIDSRIKELQDKRKEINP